MKSSFVVLQRRQGYGAVTSGFSSASDSLSDSANKATSSLSQTQIVGVVVAIIVVAVLTVALTWYCCVRQAKKRDRRNAQEEEEIRQRTERQASAVSHGSAMHVGVPMAAAGAAHYTGAASPYDRRGSDQDEDYWKREPLMPVDQMTASGRAATAGYVASGYVVDFDEAGQPRYHAQQHPFHQHTPGAQTHTPSFPTPTYERQPMYAR